MDLLNRISSIICCLIHHNLYLTPLRSSSFLLMRIICRKKRTFWYSLIWPGRMSKNFIYSQQKRLQIFLRRISTIFRWGVMSPSYWILSMLTWAGLFWATSIFAKCISIFICSLEDPKKCLSILRTVFGTFDSMPNFSVIHCAHCVKGNKSTSAQYHLLHGQLEWRLIYLTIIYKIQNNKENLKGSEFEGEMKLLIYDLVALSVSKFNKVWLN